MCHSDSFLQIYVGQSSVLHVMIYEPPSSEGGRVSLAGVKQKGFDDLIVPF